MTWIESLQPGPEFARWLRDLGEAPRVLWYPSAGADLRDLLYLHSEFLGPTADDPRDPDLFVHTDYCPGGSPVLEAALSRSRDAVFDDGRTRVTLALVEEVRVPLLPPLNRRLVTSPVGSAITGRGFFLRTRVESRRLGCFERAVLYLAVENTAFAAKVLLVDRDSRITHLFRVCYGGAFGGGRSSGRWLQALLGRLGTEVLITDGLDDEPDERPFKVFPELAIESPARRLRQYRTVEGDHRSGRRDVRWYRVEPG